VTYACIQLVHEAKYPRYLRRYMWVYFSILTRDNKWFENEVNDRIYKGTKALKSKGKKYFCPSVLKGLCLPMEVPLDIRTANG